MIVVRINHALACLMLRPQVDLSLVIKKPDFCIYENKDADNCAADQRLCFRYTSSTSLI